MREGEERGRERGKEGGRGEGKGGRQKEGEREVSIFWHYTCKLLLTYKVEYYSSNDEEDDCSDDGDRNGIPRNRLATTITFIDLSCIVVLTPRWCSVDCDGIRVGTELSL